MKKEQLSQHFSKLFEKIEQEWNFNGEIISMTVETTDNYSDRGITIYITTNNRYDTIDEVNFECLENLEVARYKNYDQITVFTFAFKTDIPTKDEFECQAIIKSVAEALK